MTKLDELKSQLSDIQKQIDQMEGEWPKDGEKYFYIGSAGMILDEIWRDDSFNRSSKRTEIGNIFPTLEKAEAELMRRKARANTWLPEEGEVYYRCDFQNENVIVSWDNDTEDWLNYHSGNVHETEVEAEAWWDKYGKYFTQER